MNKAELEKRLVVGVQLEVLDPEVFRKLAQPSVDGVDGVITLVQYDKGTVPYEFETTVGNSWHSLDEIYKAINAGAVKFLEVYLECVSDTGVKHRVLIDDGTGVNHSVLTDAGTAQREVLKEQLVIGTVLQVLDEARFHKLFRSYEGAYLEDKRLVLTRIDDSVAPFCFETEFDTFWFTLEEVQGAINAGAVRLIPPRKTPAVTQAINDRAVYQIYAEAEANALMALKAELVVGVEMEVLKNQNFSLPVGKVVKLESITERPSPYTFRGDDGSQYWFRARTLLNAIAAGVVKLRPERVTITKAEYERLLAK
jgi:hypothetical protein